ncbi:hypothetical protein ACJA88_013655 [Fusarium oxysporum]
MEDMPEYYRRQAEDRLYLSAYPHQGGKDCSKCGDDKIKARPDRQLHRAVCVHYGTIGTANSLMKHVGERDEYARDLGILCFEMEAGGLMNTWPCIVIRGICDYSDSHKNDAWHKYAALAAAAYARELICVLKPVDVNIIPPWSEEIKTAITEVYNQVSFDSKKTNTIFQHVLTEQQEAMLHWLTSIDHTVEHNRYITTQQEGTGKWFLNSKQYCSWLSSTNQALFCPGIPGAGKSVLISITIKDLSSQFASDSGIAITYLYCNSRQKEEQRIENLLGSLLSQFIRNKPSLLGEVQPFFEGEYKKKGRPSRQQISEALNYAAQSFYKSFVIIDALDECTTSHGCRKKLLSEISDLQKLSAVHVLATSRPLPDIVASFSDAERFDIRADTADVELFLDSHIKELPHRAHKSEKIQEEIKMGISEAADGMFLLARIYLNLLSHKLTHNEIRKQLVLFKRQVQGSEEGEKGIILAEAYEKTMETIQGRGQAEEALAMEALSWVTFMSRNLTIVELQHAIAVTCGEAYVDPGDLPFPEDIISLCSGLITVDPKTNTDEWFPGVHLKLARTCIGYVSSDVFANSTGWCDTEDELQVRLRCYPLYSYASLSWGFHAESVISDVQHSILDLLRDPIKMAAGIQAALLQFPSLDVEITERLTRSFTALHVAAFLGLESIVLTLIKRGHSMRGHEKIVLELLERGHAPDTRDIFGRTPLSYATEAGNERVVKLLVEKRQPIRKGFLCHMLSNLLTSNCGVNINSTDLEHCTPLHYAILRNHEMAAATLLAHDDIDANIGDENGRVPLYHAAILKHEGCVQLLSSCHGIDHNIVDHKGYSPLHNAVILQSVDGVRLLLSCNGIDPNIPDHDGFTSLYLSVIMAVRAIDKSGLDRDATPEEHLSVSGGLEQALEIVEALLELEETDPNIKDGQGSTPLHWAVRSESEVIVKTLLACESIDPNIAEKDGTLKLYKCRPEYSRQEWDCPFAYCNKRRI